jgi:MYXO-CTERM domain-containing protein
VTAVAPPATDDWAPTHYQLYELLPNDGLQHVGTSYHHQADRITLRAYAGREEGTRCYVAFANDIGGNRAPETALEGTCIDLRLGGPDAGVIDGGFLDGGTTNPDASTPGDASTPSDAGTKPRQDSGAGTGLQLDGEGGCGCSTAAGGARSAGLWSLFLLLGPLLARKRRVVRAE